jgi:hypothetical protein
MSRRKGCGAVIFDTYMNETISAATALQRESGGAVSNQRWYGNTNGKFVIAFDYDENEGITTVLNAVHTSCKNNDPDGGRPMDSDRMWPNDEDLSLNF